MPRVRKITPGSFADLGSFGSEALGGTRRVRVYLPASPPAGMQRPTLVLFDGQNVFGDDGSFSGGWHAHEAVDRLVAQRPVAPIIVAIDHGHEARIDELSPFEMRGKGGRADALLDVVTSQILPAVASRFEVYPHYRVIGGSSMGGLAALYAHARQPDTFHAAMCMSPSVWFGREALFDYVMSRPTPARARVYFDCGGREGRGRMLPLVEALALHYASRGYSMRASGERRVMWRPDKKGSHNEAAWRRRLPKALRFLFG
jgi:hypothetical protein